LDLSYLISLRDLIYKRKPSATTNDSLVYDEASEAVRGSGRPRRLPPNIPNFPPKLKLANQRFVTTPHGVVLDSITQNLVRRSHSAICSVKLKCSRLDSRWLRELAPGALPSTTTRKKNATLFAR